jgi:RNA polymerase sigma factor for flagellar operon FliA
MKIPDADRLPPEQVRELWLLHAETPEPWIINKLMLHYQPLVKYHSDQISVSLPNHIDTEDLRSYGQFGLIDAISKFDIKRGIKFETYATTRIRGEIIDQLRSIDWVPRSVRSQVKDFQKATVALEAVLGRIPTDQELAAKLGLDLVEFHRQKGSHANLHIGTLDLPVSNEDSTGYLPQNALIDNRTPDPSFMHDMEELKEAMASALGSLNEKEIIVVVLYYYESMTLADIGKVLKVTESRVCQMHTKAIGEIVNRLSMQ